MNELTVNELTVDKFDDRADFLGDANPLLAIKYQISTMIAICVSTALSTTLSILAAIQATFDDYGLVKKKYAGKKKSRKIRAGDLRLSLPRNLEYP